LIAKGKLCKSGDFIPYVICKNPAVDDGAGGSEGAGKSLAMKAYDPAFVVAAGGAIELDLQWYLEHQVLPPVARLIGPIEETDAGKCAYALGLDSKKFHRYGSKDEKTQDDEEEALLASATAADDEEKFKTAQPLHVQCPHCELTYQFPGVFHKLDGSSVVLESASSVKQEGKDGDVDMASAGAAAAAAGTTEVKREGVQGIGSGSLQQVLSGLRCPNALTKGCVGVLSSPGDDPARLLTQLSNRLMSELRKMVSRYYSGVYKCNDSSCGRRSRDISLNSKGNHCLAQGCRGRMEREYPAAQLYLQLQYYRSLFDIERARESVTQENTRRKAESSRSSAGAQSLPQLQAVLPASHAHVLKEMHAFMVQVLRQSAYHWLSPDIFNTKINAKR
jgi:DNA polymerase alpha subunit A